MISENDKKVIITLFHEELKKNKKLPTLKKIRQLTEWTGKILADLIKDKSIEKLFIEIIISDFHERISKSSTKMGSIVSRFYSLNKELYEEFFKLNFLDLQDSKEFQEKWLEIQKLIREWEEEHVWRMESWKYRDFSSSVNEKYIEYIKTFFPYYGLVGVTIKKI